MCVCVGEVVSLLKSKIEAAPGERDSQGKIEIEIVREEESSDYATLQ